MKELDPGFVGIPNVFRVAGATPGETIHFVLGTQPGSTEGPGCIGTVLDTGNPRVLVTQVRGGGY